MGKLFVLDPGHGGRDPGATGNGLSEKDIALDIAKRIASKLQQYEDVDVKLTRSDDRYLGLSERAVMANIADADFFLSVHVNAGGGTGFESFVYSVVSEETKTIQAMIHAEIRKFLDARGISDRGAKSANFAVLRETAMPAMLIECLFIDNPRDAELLKQSEFLDALAGAVINGLVRAFSLTKKETSIPLEDSVDTLVKAGVISSPDYWLANAVAGRQVSGSNVASLLIKMATKI